MDTINSINETENASTIDKKPKSKLWLIAVIVVVVVALVITAYLIYSRSLKQKNTTANSVPDSSSTSTTTTAPVTASTDAAQSVSDIKSQLEATNIGQVQSTVTGLKNSFSMFNR